MFKFKLFVSCIAAITKCFSSRFIFELFGKMNVTFSNKTALADVLDKIVTYLNNESKLSVK